MRWRIVASIAAIVAATVLAAPAASARPGDTDGELAFGGLTRSYVLHLPTGGAVPNAVVVNLHGGGGTGRGEEQLTHYDAVADAHGFAVVYPNGTDRNWADGRGASQPDRRGVDDVGFLVALVEKITAQYGIAPGRVFATGMSNGGFMVNRLGCDRPDVFAAIAPVAGTLGSGVPCRPTMPVAVFETHGTADPIVPFDGGPMEGRGGQSEIMSAPDLVAQWRTIDGCRGAVSDVTLPDAHDGTIVHRFDGGCPAGTDVAFLRVDNGGHTWPGGSQYLPRIVIGGTSRAVDESEASWQFFDAHAR